MLLDKYLAPKNESAIFKNIPIGLLIRVKLINADNLVI